MGTKSLIKSTNRLLRVMIALLVRRGERGVTINLREQISVLSNLGLKPKEIAEILGRKGLYVNKELSQLRRTKRKKT